MISTPFFTRLFRYRTSAAKTPTEDFLTEVLSELISRAPHSIQTELICEAFLPQFIRSNFREITRGQTINARSQMSIEQGRSIDLVIFSGGKPVIAV